MHHTYKLKTSESRRIANLLGATSLAIADILMEVSQKISKAPSRDNATLNSVLQWPGGTIEELSAVAGLSHSATVRLVDRGVKQGLLERRAGHSAREVSIWLTAEGRKMARSIESARAATLEKLINLLNKQEQTTLRGIAQKILHELTTSARMGDHICRLCSASMCPQDICPVACRQKSFEAKTT